MFPLSERSEKRGKSKGELISFCGILCSPFNERRKQRILLIGN
jgi:hypothetical protein